MMPDEKYVAPIFPEPFPEWLEHDLSRFLVCVWRIARATGGSVTSGCRSVKHNHEVGGSRWSRHTWPGGHGMAVDLVFDTEAGCERAKQMVLGLALHYYQGPGYGDKRLHIQGVPPRRDAGPIGKA